ncbi:MAG: hypothetical protein JST92_01350 [Deltaproteobacteria bacterium]|nr:hypothetical protein [Deltaproteobacteria bacterium]
MTTSPDLDARRLRARAALLFFLGLLTGIWVGVVFTEGRALSFHLDFHPKFPRLALGAHLNALLGCFWMIAVASTLERMADGARKWVVRLTTLVAYANWFVTLIASMIDERGLAFDANPRNDLVAVLLMLGVVLPGLTAAGVWAWSLRKDLNAQ